MVQLAPRRAANSLFIVMLGLTGLLVADPLHGQDYTPLTQSAPRDYSSLAPPSVPFLQGPVIPGLEQHAVPQGITYLPEQNRILISNDFDDAPSRVSVLDNMTGKVISSVVLKEATEQLHHGHVGGIAAIGGSLWVASDRQVLQYELESFLSDPPSDDAVPLTIHQANTNADFCTATADTLFVGEFAYGVHYRTDPSHHITDRKGIRKYAWVCGYAANDAMGSPTCVFSVRQRVQGMHITNDRVYLSLSYGRRNRSTIVVYRNPLREPSHSRVTFSDGTRVPLWFLDGENYLREIDYPPMAEGITMIDNRLAVLSESGATKFQPRGKGPLDYILLLDVRENP